MYKRKSDKCERERDEKNWRRTEEKNYTLLRFWNHRERERKERELMKRKRLSSLRNSIQSKCFSVGLLITAKGSKIALELFFQDFHRLTEFDESGIIIIIAGIFDLPTLTGTRTGIIFISVPTVRFRCDFCFFFDFHSRTRVFLLLIVAFALRRRWTDAIEIRLERNTSDGLGQRESRVLHRSRALF